MEHFVSNPEKEYEFTFSIIMAVYNVEPFIAEAIDSLINQDIGFEYHVQLILVDDGSPDGSGEICDEYQQKYPDNIEVIHKENGGVSSARNAGIPLAKGKYVNFMDSDDKLSTNTLQNVFFFFEKYYFDVDVVAIPMVYFNGKRGDHPTNHEIFKKGTRVIDLTIDYQCILLSMSRSFVKRNMIQDESFDTRLKIAEDGKVVQKILLDKQKLGAVARCKYWYRKRTDGCPSALDTSSLQKEFYINSLEFFTLEILEIAIQQEEKIPKFLQFTLMYELVAKFKLREIPEGVLTEEDKKLFFQLIKQILRVIDDEIIMQQKQIFIEHKLAILNLKYGNVSAYVPLKDDVILYRNHLQLFRYSSIYARYDFIKYQNNSLYLEGRVMTFDYHLVEETPIYLLVNGEKVDCDPITLYEHKYSLGEPILCSVGFKISLPIEKQVENYSILLYSCVKGFPVLHKEIRFGKFSPIGSEFKNSYYYKEGRVLLLKGHTLLLQKCGIKGHIEHEKLFLQDIGKIYREKLIKISLTRLLVKVVRKVRRRRKEIWLISDRVDRADDNGKAFFMYLKKKKPKNVKFYFVIAKHSPDYKAMKKYGSVVNFKSYKNKFLHLLAGKVVSSAFSEFVINPFEKNKLLYRDLLQEQEFIFLQHGIIMNDLSSLLQKYVKNVKLFITSTKIEHTSILEYNYYYSTKENNVLLSGLPRYDLLYRSSKKYVTVMPTWRRYLVNTFNTETGIWDLIPNFKESDYFLFFNALINHQGLLEIAKKYRYTLVFMPHPCILPHISQFEHSSDVEFIHYDKPYREIYAESDLVITDYSSASFDFSYLRKPVIYTQFDKEAFFSGEHTVATGYFEHERDGFGEVEYDLESTVNRIIEYMENGCQLKDKYRERIDNFFAFNDQNNCERVYNAIMDLDKEEEKN